MSEKEGSFSGEMDNFSGEIDYRQIRMDQEELLQIRMDLLEKQERLVLEIYLQHNFSVNQMGELAGKEPRALARRMRRLIKGLLGDEYINVIRHKSEFTPLELKAAYDHYLLGMGYRSISRKRMVTKHAAEVVLRRLKKWMKENEVRKVES